MICSRGKVCCINWISSGLGVECSIGFSFFSECTIQVCIGSVLSGEVEVENGTRKYLKPDVVLNCY